MLRDGPSTSVPVVRAASRSPSAGARRETRLCTARPGATRGAWATAASDCEAEQRLTPNSELRMLHSIAGHFGLFGFEQSYLDEVDQHLSDLLAVER